MTRRPPSSTLFPYTTLFRSNDAEIAELARLPVTKRRFVPNRAKRITSASFGGRVWITNGPVLEEKDRRSEEHTSELQSQSNLVCRLLLEKKNFMVLDTTPQ